MKEKIEVFMIRNKLIKIFIIMYLVFGASGCAQAQTDIEKIDSNKDGKTDILYYFRDGVKVKESIDYLDGAFKSRDIEWDNDGNIIKVVTTYKSSKTDPFSSYFKKGQVEAIEGEKYNKQELDRGKTYAHVANKEWIKKNKDKSYVYSKNGKIIFSIVDYNGDNRIEEASFYDEYGRIKKILEDLDRDGYFDHMKVFSFGKQISDEKINISADTPLMTLKNYTGKQ